ncbi:MAG: UDP-2,3-diacylglucosamine diphosphatase [SAR86 cluster bacterium]|nr:UDP-2,3-diacylglucosamine diphosphatase [SAR86 cluster bacterium]
MSHCFISDLHLTKERPEITAAFFTFLESIASDANYLYILGDLFEMWIGDDSEDELSKSVKDQLRNLAKNSCNIYLMHGNRDFLIGEKFSKECDIQLIEDPINININNKNILLMHGDSLCVEDVKYQEFRAATRINSWKEDFLKKPIKERILIAESLRSKSKAETRGKTEDIMDVSKEEVIKVMSENQTSFLIHGHTHRPKIHNIKLATGPAHRVVLGDWDIHGWYIWIDSNSWELKKFSIL